MRQLKNVVFAAAAALLLFSCATKAEVYAPVDEAVAQADFEAALEAIETAQTPPEGKKKAKKPIYPEKNAVMLYLDKGVLEHYAEKYDESAANLEESERLIEEAFTKSVSAEVASYIANDNSKDYAGEDFEDLFTNIMSSLNYYHKGDLDGALVEVRKVDEKLVLLNDKYADAGGKMKQWVTEKVNNVAFPDMGLPANITTSALADYLALLFMRHSVDSNERINETRRALVRVNEAINAYPGEYIPNSWDPSLQRNFKVGVPASLKISGTEGYETAEELEIPEGKARLNVIAFSGQSPIKGEHNMPVLFPFFRFVPDGELALPAIVFRSSAVNSVEVAIAGGEKFKLDLLEDYDYIVTETFRAKFTNIFLKTYIRTVVKYMVAEAAGVAAENNKPGTGMLMARIAKKGMDASESADIRMSRYMPGRAYVGGITLDPGEYTITITYEGGDTVTKTVNAQAGKLNLVEAICLK